MKCKNVLDTVGKTPLIRLKRIAPDLEVYGKAEFMNPGGSVKDRIALNMINEAEMQGKLKTGDTFVEPTSGNTGIALAMVAAAKGYKVVFVMPEAMSIERRKLLQQYGAEIILVQGLGMEPSIEKAKELVREKGYFMPQQFQNPANPAAHYDTTGPEIYKDLPEVDILVAGVGTGGSVSGIGKFLKEQNPEIRIIAVEPVGSPVLSGGAKGPHKIQGIGAGFVPGTYNGKYVDEIIQVANEDGFKTSRSLAKKEGILVGISAGANVFVAMQVAKQNPGKKVVTILCDTGERYLSTELFD